MRRVPVHFRSAKPGEFDQLKNLKIIVFGETEEIVGTDSLGRVGRRVIQKEIAINVGVGWQVISVSPDGKGLNLKGYLHEQMKEKVAQCQLFIDEDQERDFGLENVELVYCMIRPSSSVN